VFRTDHIPPSNPIPYHPTPSHTIPPALWRTLSPRSEFDDGTRDSSNPAFCVHNTFFPDMKLCSFILFACRGPIGRNSQSSLLLILWIDLHVCMCECRMFWSQTSLCECGMSWFQTSWLCSMPKYKNAEVRIIEILLDIPII